MAIYYLCPDEHVPYGGVRVIYDHVDTLRRHGYHAFVLHERQGFRCTWFENSTPVAYWSSARAGLVGALRHLPVLRRHATSGWVHRSRPPTDVTFGPDDYLVVPEIYGPGIGEIAPGVRKIIFNQNPYYTFVGYTLDLDDETTPYRHSDVIGVVVVSEDAAAYVRAAFPEVSITRVRPAVDPRLFYFEEEKNPQIAFMTRKFPEDVRQVVNLLKFRRRLPAAYRLVEIPDASQPEVARVLRASAIFLSFGHPEGLSLPPAEAMACGCITIGYHGMGGREYLRPDLAFPIDVGEIVKFTETVEDVAIDLSRDPGSLRERARKAATFVAEQYSPERQEGELVEFWQRVTARPRPERLPASQ
jgi:glycosyltransferase involved in cell wall biosynthesis